MEYRYEFKCNRESIEFIKKISTKELVGAEIGVHAGNNSLYILQNLNIKKLYLIDSWYEYNNLPKEKTEYLYKETMDKLKNYIDKIEVMVKKSHNAAREINNESLDFCYIDGDHTYRGVSSDLRDYYKKVKIGGILCGHDYNTNGQVTNAVNKFANNNDFRVYHKVNKEVRSKPIEDWWIIK